jgi:hypothetical protein
MKIRFLADADLNEDIVAGLLRLEPAIDFQLANQAELTGLPDPVVLAYASEAGRILVSHDHRTMPKHFAELLNRETSPGVIIILQSTKVRVAIEALLLHWAASEAEEWRDRLIHLPL